MAVKNVYFIFLDYTYESFIISKNYDFIILNVMIKLVPLGT